ncbi:ROK family protein [Croceicoccus ponticola]|uniref:fructokinase n=1 Tax=Croceicoccus ponticola TaxID=2217664 RepID=A0A437GZU2_9SPHN|nr:ROK family protein [Croceicoccus ponticola]RVQ68812.1 ROK family protein [Croceicoccus ponticola]
MTGGTAQRLAGIELGGTKTIVVLGDGTRIVERREFPTTTPDETMGAALAVLGEWNRAAPLDAIGIGSFGPLRVDAQAADFGTILATPKRGWSGAQILAPVRRAFACPIGVDTDVNAAALAEHALGAAQGCGNVIYLTIGTGLGGGVLLDGRPVHGAMHPEIGHVRLRRVAGDAFAGVCPFHGDCIEGLIAGPALEARLPAHPADLDPVDPAWDPVGMDLAELLAQLMLTFSPQRIVIGGGVANRQPHLIARARDALPGLIAGYLGDMDAAALSRMICAPTLGDDAGPVGSLVLAAQAMG